MTRSIFGMFGPSPIRPLQKHMKTSCECAKALEGFFAAVTQGNWKDAEKQQAHIVLLEHEADEMKKELRLHLPKGLFLPVPRTDVLELLAIQDSIANKAKDIAGMILGRKMEFPESLTDDLLSFYRRTLDAAKQAEKAINELDELLETGFRGREVEIVEEMITKLDEIESDTDEMQVNIRQKLFELEKELPPINVIFLYKIFDWIGDLADRSQSVGGRLLMLLAG